MKHNLKITSIILIMFVLTQLVGILVISNYMDFQISDGIKENKTSSELPYGMEPPSLEKEREPTIFSMVLSLIFAFVIAITLFLILARYNVNFIIKIWFFLVVIIALGISLTALLPFKYASLIALLIAIPLAILKVYKRNFLVHNISELLVYPGIASIFVLIQGFNSIVMVILLVLISAYDMWAVWHSGVMQKMAKYQINTLNVFPGFFIPYLSKRMKNKVKKLRQESKKQKNKKSKSKNKNIRANVAILGGGDVVFPTITAGVLLKDFGFYTIAGLQIPLAPLIAIFFGTLGLAYLLLSSEKKRFYPAMPFISAGLITGIAISYLLDIFVF